ncbi:hypothetical protein KM043_017735 [Ampulex compressa]|nr:hypothetical protein KM043_017735 [Ampulex compressa]
MITFRHKLLCPQVCVSALVFCVTLMIRMWFNFSDNPTVTVIDTSNPIWKLPFPAVTICNNNKVYKPHADAIATVLSSNGFDRTLSNKLFSSLMKLIRPDKIEIDNSTASWALDILGFTVERLMYELMQPCSSLLVRCAWLGQIYDCSKIFKTVKSNEGFCCGFNYHYELSKSYGYDHFWLKNLSRNSEIDFLTLNSSAQLPGVKKILDAPGAGRDVGLAVALNIEGQAYKSSVRPYVGATILIHDPIDFPDIGIQSATVRNGHVLAVSVTGTGIGSGQDIRKLPLHKRNCLFDGETSGERSYSYQTCISECLHKRIQESCGCLPFFYSAMRMYAQLKMSHVDECKCLPQCSEKTYNIVTEGVLMDDVGYDSEITRNLNVRNTSFVYVYFGDVTYLEYRKQSIMTWDSLLASFGGIFGLCLGGSVMSLVELLYHLTMEFLGFRKRQEGRPSNGFPPASEMFLRIALEEGKRNERKTGPIDRRLVLPWNSNVQRRNRNSSAVGLELNQHQRNF